MSVAQWSLAELRAAYASQAERRLHTITVPQPTTVGTPVGAVGVLGVSGGVGTTTVALALAEALKVKRLLEFAPPHASGLAGAATDELGERDGWRIGVRGELELARRIDPDDAPGSTPGEAVLDLGAWSGSALGHDVACLVVVAGASVPSIRRLEACLQVIDGPRMVPVITRAGRRLPRDLVGAAGPRVRAALAAGVVQLLPECRRLALTGLTPDPLPRSLQQSAAGLALVVKETP
ncbi:hypothetical protein BW730_14305 [Tessaracoccus aquimaris]|uniref:CobQ/CobB/MinD/ParA nucleotide binding domain-containing protein n=1 Tax=Tessaracoccus aquimaris TaxID=1332264 RepID=A0A1Q2CR13_9ACTN|nr:hypothetical protein [Tessaracoccus aquimaris]AQP48505.1 hypothetical protein BW730_14305 [Tessaracoccus aquimaris]